MDKLNCAITILFNEDGLKIEIKDVLSGVTFVRAQLDAGNTCKAMSRLAHTPATMEVQNLDAVGKHVQMAWIHFQVPDVLEYKEEKQFAMQKVKEICDGTGWEPNLYFESRDSFYTEKGKGRFAKTIIKAWCIDPRYPPPLPFIAKEQHIEKIELNRNS